MIDILLATYNGEKFLREMLDSILKCDQNDFINKIIISDDNSTDSTLSILREYELANNKITVITNKGVRGVNGNFQNAFFNSTADYLIFCDQDDIWCHDRVTVALDGIHNMESIYGVDVPLLFFTDFFIVNKHVEIIAESFFKNRRVNLDSYINSNEVFLKNEIPGCAMIVNRNLAKLAFPFNDIPVGCLHDWWMLIIAKLGGRIGFSNKATFKYRLHDNNVVGIKSHSILEKVRRNLFDDTFNFYLFFNYIIVFCHRKGLKIEHVFFKNNLNNTEFKCGKLSFLFKLFRHNILYSKLIHNVRLVYCVLFK